jgi:hypothetical protein
MRWEFRLVYFACYRRSDNRWAVFVADVVLNDEYGAYPALLTPDYRA